MRHLLDQTIKAMLMVMLMAGASQSHAQPKPYSILYLDHKHDVPELIVQSLASDMASRQQPRKNLSTTQYLLNDDTHLWTNGVILYVSEFDPVEKEILFQPYFTNRDVNDLIAVPRLKVKGRRITVSDDQQVNIGIERIAGHIMLVGRNAQGMPVLALHHVNRDEVDDNRWTLLAQYMIMGNYTIARQDAKSSTVVVFGPKLPHYSGYQYDTDPGILNGYYIPRDLQSMDILYGDQRPSRGDPSDPRWGKMPGGGGAAAIMGPMEWNLVPTVEGFRVIVRHDERFVFHAPAIGEEGDTVMLYKLQSPYEGLPGKWAIASVIPLTETLLQLFPKEVLTLMRGEIYARHGDTFKDRATQEYFDGQEWYQRGHDKAIVLSDVERFNYQLIKQVEKRR